MQSSGQTVTTSVLRARAMTAMHCPRLSNRPLVALGLLRLSPVACIYQSVHQPSLPPYRPSGPHWTLTYNKKFSHITKEPQPSSQRRRYRHPVANPTLFFAASRTRQLQWHTRYTMIYSHLWCGLCSYARYLCTRRSPPPTGAQYEYDRSDERGGVEIVQYRPYSTALALHLTSQQFLVGRARVGAVYAQSNARFRQTAPTRLRQRICTVGR